MVYTRLEKARICKIYKRSLKFQTIEFRAGGTASEPLNRGGGGGGRPGQGPRPEHRRFFNLEMILIRVTTQH